MNFDSIIDAAFNKVSETFRKSEREALIKVLNHLKQEAANRAPIDKGDLRASAKVDELFYEGRTLTGSVSFNTPYALRMHEDYYKLGPTSLAAGPQVGRKFLQRALMDNKASYIKFMKDTIDYNIVGSFNKK